MDNRTQRYVFNQPITLRLSKNNFDLHPNHLFSVERKSFTSGFEHKLSRDQAYLVIKQKRYVAKKFRYTSLPNNFIAGLGLYTSDMDLRAQKHMHIHSKNYDSALSSPMHKRLLRTRRILVLPAHVNLAVITNSFDVIHS